MFGRPAPGSAPSPAWAPDGGVAARGNSTRIVVPGVMSPSTQIRPPDARTVEKTVASPSPLLPRSALVVKNGRKTRSRISSSMPRPVSLTLSSSIPCADAIASGWSPLASSSSIDSRPPSGIASWALTARLTSTCSSWARSASTHGVAGGRAERDLDLHADRAFEHREQAADEVGKVERLGTDDAWAPEREQLLGQCRGTVSGGPDLLRGFELIPGREPRHQQFAEAVDHHQQVVEVVGDAACKLTDGLHPLRQAQPLLEAAAFTDIDGHDDPARPAIEQELVAGHLHLDHRPVTTDVAERFAADVPAWHRPQPLAQARPVVGMDEPVDGQRARLVVAVPVLVHRGIVDGHDPAVRRIPDRHGDRMRLEQPAIGLGVGGHCGTGARCLVKNAIVRRHASSAASGSWPTCIGRRRPSQAVTPS